MIPPESIIPISGARMFPRGVTKISAEAAKGVQRQKFPAGQINAIRESRGVGLISRVNRFIRCWLKEGMQDIDFIQAVILYTCDWVVGSYQCWSESGLMSLAVSPSPQGQSPSPSPLGQSPSPSGVSPSPLDQSPSLSPSPLDQSPSPSPVGQSPSPQVQQKSEWVQTWVRTQPGLMSPTIEKCFILILL